MFCVNIVNAKALTEVGREKDRFRELFVGILVLILAELVSCETTALTGAPREGFCLAPEIYAKMCFDKLVGPRLP